MKVEALQRGLNTRIPITPELQKHLKAIKFKRLRLMSSMAEEAESSV